MINLFVLASVNNAQDGEFNIRVRSIRLDLTTLLYINDASGLVNVEFLKMSGNSFGIEPGISLVSAGVVGGSEQGSPFRDYNLMLYSLFRMGKPTSLKFTFGYTNRTSIADNLNQYPDSQLKLGVSFYWDLLKYFGLCIRYTHPLKSSHYSASGIGVGCSFNWSQ